ncbi:BspA family leucine-rich repeat surface protein [Segatella copri]|uniref:BspA family leucine-rich repeat surface protein n=3 Tax=Segatella copri TaxID=165179 RepID=UPI00129138BB|nr:BspA family leucine-rich repeat surface protein [Segatella copri]MQN74839.1 BspA family leucine-rich repeat surface protein [Segatella copri]MQO44300.1 BspA family leucine-rich repeat surface protein [Segatella copri]MQO51371.1 BspA family leucine-rich repeat surface protein [Segatella copri]
MGRKPAVCTMGGAIIRRFALFPLMLLILLLLPAGMVAQTEASSSKYIATYESSTQTLTFKENVGETLPENSALVKDKKTVREINRKLGNVTIVHIVFDKSFSTYTPTSLNGFFTYLEKLETITGLEYLNTEKVTDMCNMFSGCSKLTSLDVSKFNTVNVTDMSGMFNNCSKLPSLDVTNFNTEKVTNMSRMFSNCSKLTSLDVTKFNTANVTDMSRMFEICQTLTSLDVTKFNTANVTNMSGMFYYCSKLTSLDVTKFNTANVTNMSTMFSNCQTLTSLDVTKFNTANVTDMSRMFSNCQTLTSLDVTKFNTANVTNMSTMFSNCSKLTSLDVTKFNTANVTNMSRMFSGCTNLTSLDGTKFNTANVSDMSDMFSGCLKLTSLDVSKFNTVNVLNMSRMFSNCDALTSLDLTNFNTEKVTYMSSMFSDCDALTSLDVTNFNTANVTDMSSMFCRCVALTSLYLTNFNTEKVTNMKNMFWGCQALTTIYASSKFVTTQVTNSSYMFYNCEKLKGEEVWKNDKATDKTYAKIEGGYFSGGIPRVKYADGTLTFFLASKETLGENEYGIYDGWATPDWVWQNPNVTNVTKVVFDPAFANARPTKCNEWFQNYVNLTSIEGIEYLNTSQVTDMHNMFYNCYHLQTTDFSGFDTRKVTNMSNMFYNCGSLKSLDISNFNTSEVTNMRNMFYHCIGLTSLDLSHLNTSKVSIMISMFQLCSNLLSVNLSGWDTRNVGSMDHMFEGCKSLKTLDLSGFDTREKTCAMDDMFNTCNELTTIFVSDKFAVGTRGTGDGTMFQGCNKLKGANALDKNNPQTGIDNANYKTGYFTKLVGKNGDEKIGATGETLATDNLALDDDKDFVAYEPFAAKAASYNRTMKEGTTWATLCLPFEVSLENQNFRAFKLLSADDVTETVELEEIEGSIAAGTPVIIKMKDGATKLNFTEANKEIAKDVQTAETANGNYQLQGLYTQKEFSKDTDNNCYIVKGSKLMNPAKLLDKTTTESVGSKPFRAYMVGNSSAPAAGARMFSISVGGSTTAIEQLESTADSKAEYYDLQGRRLQDLQKGINIVKRGGKTMKVIIK